MAEASPAGRHSCAKLVVGCPATDTLLLCEGLNLDDFASPLIKQLSVPMPKGAPSCPCVVRAGCMLADGLLESIKIRPVGSSQIWHLRGGF